MDWAQHKYESQEAKTKKESLFVICYMKIQELLFFSPFEPSPVIFLSFFTYFVLKALPFSTLII